MTKTQEISRRILTLVANGVDVIEAAKQVLGSDRIDAMIGDLYTQLRTQA